MTVTGASIADDVRETADSDPRSALEQLKSRSAADRWKRLSSKLDRSQQAAPAVPVPQRVPTLLQQAPLESIGAEVAPAPPKVPVPIPDPTFLPQSNGVPPIPQTASRQVYSDVPTAADPETFTPKDLKSVTSILPYFDYEPDPEAARDNPCKNLCPRPDGMDCPEVEGNICPIEVTLSEDIYYGRHFTDSLFQWQASNLFHNPLYFDDPSLERYGHTHPALVQPFVSAAKFGVRLVGLPYQMAIDPPKDRKYILGWYRPGECAPKKYYQIPFNANAALLQAGVVTGLIYAIP